MPSISPSLPAAAPAPGPAPAPAPGPGPAPAPSPAHRLDPPPATANAPVHLNGDASAASDAGLADHQPRPASPSVSDAHELKRQQSLRFVPTVSMGHRRLQTLAVFLWGLSIPICLILFFFCCSIPLFWPLVIPYLIWVFCIDKAPENGGRPQAWLRRSKFWRYFAEYYPISCIKTADLPPDRPYVFGYHPHGVIGMGALANFASEATEFATSFPGIQTHLLTLASNFKLPFFRDFIMALGTGSVSRASCENILRQGPGTSITIVVGGATESLKAHPGTADLTLRRRLGFIKIAIRNGASLVPVFAFGENDIYAQLANEKGTAIYQFQKRFQALFGFTLPLFHGRGVFNYHIGLLPFRHPIVACVGRPIETVQNKHPTQAEIEEVQERYIAELKRIWDTWKDQYAANRTKELTID